MRWFRARRRIEEVQKARKTTALDHLFEGAVVTGVVKNLTEYGAFVDLGGIDGLLHASGGGVNGAWNHWPQRSGARRR